MESLWITSTFTKSTFGWDSIVCQPDEPLWLPARWAPGFSGDHQQNHQRLWLLCYSCILPFIVCILLGIKLLLLLIYQGKHFGPNNWYVTYILTNNVACLFCVPSFPNTLSPRQNGQHFANVIFKCIFLKEHLWISIKTSLKFVPKGPINNIPALVHIMAWRRPGDRPLFEPIMVKLLTHIRVTLVYLPVYE